MGATVAWLTAMSPEKRRYALEAAVRHLADSGSHVGLVRLLTELEFLETKARAGMVFELASDFGEGVRALPRSNEHRWALELL